MVAADLTFEPHLTGGRPELTRDRGRLSKYEGSALGGGWIWVREWRAGVEAVGEGSQRGTFSTPWTAV